MLSPKKWLLTVWLIVLTLGVVGVDFYVLRKQSLLENKLKKEIENVVKETKKLEDEVKQLRGKTLLKSKETSEINVPSLATYKNEIYGFEFKYPETYAHDKYACAREEGNFVLVGARIEIGIFDSNNLNLDEYVQTYLNREFSQEAQKEGYIVESKEEIAVGGERAIKISYRFGGMGRYGERIFVLHNQKVYIFNMTAGGESSVAYEKGPDEWTTFYQIIESFKFIK
jgi:hypothetical protein